MLRPCSDHPTFQTLRTTRTCVQIIENSSRGRRFVNKASTWWIEIWDHGAESRKLLLKLLISWRKMNNCRMQNLKRWLNRISFIMSCFIHVEGDLKIKQALMEIVTRWHHNSDEYEHDAMLHHRSPTMCEENHWPRKNKRISSYSVACVFHFQIFLDAAVSLETKRFKLRNLLWARHFRNSNSIWVKTLINSFHFRWRFCLFSFIAAICTKTHFWTWKLHQKKQYFRMKSR